MEQYLSKFYWDSLLKIKIKEHIFLFFQDSHH